MQRILEDPYDMIIEIDQEVQGDVSPITRARAKKTQAQFAIKES